MVDPNASIARSFAGHVRKPVMSVVFCQSFLQRLGEMLELFVRNEPCRPQQSGDKAHGSCDFSFHFDQLFSWTHRLAQTEGTKKNRSSLSLQSDFFFSLFPPHPPPKEKANQTSSTIYCFERNCLFLLFLLGFVLWAQKQNTTDFFFPPFVRIKATNSTFSFLLFLFFFPSLITKASLRCVRVGCFFCVCFFFL